MLKAEQTRDQKELQNLEWMKEKLRIVCMVPTYCGLCLETAGNMYPLKMEFAINESYSTKPLREVVSSVLNCDIEENTTSDVICEQCTEKTIQSYVFIENTKKVFKILSHCIGDMLSKANDIDNELDQNCDYLNTNVMIVVEYDEETYRSVDEITSGNNTILSDKPREKDQHIGTNTVLNKEIVVEKEKKIKQTKEPLIKPVIRVTKHPRNYEIQNEKDIQKNESKPAKEDKPTVSLEGGKILITPLTTNTPVIPNFNVYKCNSCPCIFTTYKTLKEHEKELHNTTVFQCRLCTKKYSSRQYLDVHYKAAHSKSRCRICEGLFDIDELNSHLREKHEKLVHTCKLCDLVYHSFEQLETHVNSAHDVKNNNNMNKTQCVMCLRSFSETEIKSHKCKFYCLQCTVAPCIHYSYLMSYKEQVLNHAAKIRCLDCDYTTKRKEHLLTHVNREHLNHHPFTCNDCGTQFYTKLSLRRHIIQFHHDLKCQYCDEEFKSPELLGNHRNICKTITRKFCCEECVASFDLQNELNKHKELYHSSIVYPCNLCKKEYLTAEALKEHHARIHNGIQYRVRRKFIECTLCDITFRCTKEMIEHEKTHKLNEVFPCKVCPKLFRSLKQVYFHKQRHYSQRTKCPGCKKSLASSYFIQHKVVCPYLKSPENLPYVCNICNKGFHLESLLRIHRRMHSEAKPCQYCNKLIKPMSLKKHIESRHPDEIIPSSKANLLLKCSYCDYTTRKKIYLENHVNKIHYKIKPYTCEICHKSFCGKSRLDEHVRTHKDNNVCYCSYCGKKFANKVCLKMHNRRHTGEKPYECNICFERFRSASIMKTHRLKKHLDKTIQCPLCDSMYHLAAEMRFHVKKVHWKRPDPFDFKQIIPEQYHHLFEDQRLQKLGKDSNKLEE